MKIWEFDYELPEELIAQEPSSHREFSRLMVLKKDNGSIEHQYFKDILNYFKPGDTLVLNESKVIPARLIGVRNNSGASVEVLLLRPLDSNRQWEVMVKPGKKARVGDSFSFGEKLSAQVIDINSSGNRIMEFYFKGAFLQILEEVGSMPLPPYIKKQPQNPNRYQTVFANTPGSVAAPTAGLHFTKELLNKIKDMGVNVVFILLHVGLGTFRPVKVEDIEEHHMHEEFFEITPETAQTICDTKKAGNRVICVGTTSTRCLESVASKEGTVTPCSGWTDLFIYPGYEFKVVDGLVTNFHLPKSTLLMLVAAFAGKDNILHAYKVAVQNRYRFFSFGDAMFMI